MADDRTILALRSYPVARRIAALLKGRDMTAYGLVNRTLNNVHSDRLEAQQRIRRQLRETERLLQGVRRQRQTVNVQYLNELFTNADAIDETPAEESTRKRVEALKEWEDHLQAKRQRYQTDLDS